jgi:multidrug efflux system membrane fusion protein
MSREEVDTVAQRDTGEVVLKTKAPMASPEEDVVADESPSPSTGRRRWPYVVGLLVVAAVVAYFLSRGPKKATDPASMAAVAAKGAPAVPVVTVAARTEDVPVLLTGLGTVTPLNTVTVRSRVDGQLMSVGFKEGQYVRAGEVLAEIDPRPFQVDLTKADGQMAKDAATLANSKLDLARFQSLADDGLIPGQQLDLQKSTVTVNEAALKTDQGGIDAAKLDLVYAKITAPISGRAGLRLVAPGNMVHATDAAGIVVLTEVEPIAVLFTIPQDSLPSVLSKSRAGDHLQAEAWNRDLTQKLATGELLTIDNQIDPSTGTIRLKAVFPNTDGALFPNQFVNVRLKIDTLKGAVVIPAAAVQRSPQSSYVYVVKADQTVAMRPVVVSMTQGETAAISKGVAAGDAVVVDGLDKLQEGSKVVPRGADAPAPKKRKA